MLSEWGSIPAPWTGELSTNHIFKQSAILPCLSEYVLSCHPYKLYPRWNLLTWMGHEALWQQIINMNRSTLRSLRRNRQPNCLSVLARQMCRDMVDNLEAKSGVCRMWMMLVHQPLISKASVHVFVWLASRQRVYVFAWAWTMCVVATRCPICKFPSKNNDNSIFSIQYLVWIISMLHLSILIINYQYSLIRRFAMSWSFFVMSCFGGTCTATMVWIFVWVEVGGVDNEMNDAETTWEPPEHGMACGWVQPS